MTVDVDTLMAVEIKSVVQSEITVVLGPEKCFNSLCPALAKLWVGQLGLGEKEEWSTTSCQVRKERCI